MSEQDPYCYPGSIVLRNLFDLRTQAELSRAEADITYLRLGQIERLPPTGKFDLNHLKEIHRRIFRDVYPWAGELRTVSMSKGGSLFCRREFLATEGQRIFDQLRQENLLRALPQGAFCERLSYYFGEINALHPFREGNGRTQRVMLESIAKQAGYKIDFQQITRETMVTISRDAQVGRLESTIATFGSIISPVPVRSQDSERSRGKSKNEGR